jgi:hypothetical protein
MAAANTIVRGWLMARGVLAVVGVAELRISELVWQEGWPLSAEP